jgi:hypothetical protein
MVAQRIARFLPAAVALVVLAGARPPECAAWSLLHPFSSDAAAETTASQPPAKPATKEPSVLTKVGTGTKSFFNRAGEAVGLKKPEPKQPEYARVISPTVVPPKKPESKSWFATMFGPEEPEKPKTVSEWLGNDRLDEP